MCPSATSGVSLPVTKPRAESSFDGLPPGYSPCVNRTVIAVEPRLPQPRGPLSAVVIDLLAKGSPSAHPDDVEEMLAAANPYGLDLQLALCVCYELHYRGFSGVDPRWEWDIGLLNLRRRLEEDFLARLESDAGQDSHEYAIAAELDALMREPEDDANLSVHLAEYASWEHMQEYLPSVRSTTSRRATRRPGLSRGCPARPRPHSWPSSSTSSAAGTKIPCTRVYLVIYWQPRGWTPSTLDISNMLPLNRWRR